MAGQEGLQNLLAVRQMAQGAESGNAEHLNERADEGECQRIACPSDSLSAPAK